MKTFFYTFIFSITLLLIGALQLNADCPQIVRGPYVQPVNNSGDGTSPQAVGSAIVRWRTNEYTYLRICFSISEQDNFGNCKTVWPAAQDIVIPYDDDTYDIQTVYNYQRLIDFSQSPFNDGNIYDYRIQRTKDSDDEGCTLIVDEDEEPILAKGTLYSYPDKGTVLNDPLDIWVLGDPGDARLLEVREAYNLYKGANNKDDFIMLLGDNAYNATEDGSGEYDIDCDSGDICEPDGNDYAYSDAIFADDKLQQEIRSQIMWTAIGNHEVDYDFNKATSLGEKNLEEFSRIFDYVERQKGYYSFDYGQAHFICLNSEIDNSSSDRDAFDKTMTDMTNWLVNDLNNNDAKWTIVYFHHPIYTGTSKKGRNTLVSDEDVDNDSLGLKRDIQDDMKRMISSVAPILDQYEVDLVLTGHCHHYERSFLVDGHYNINNSSLLDFDDQNPDMLLDTGCGDCLDDYYDNPNTFDYSRFESNFTKTDKGSVYVILGSSGKKASPAIYQDFFNLPMMRPFNPPTSFTETIEDDGEFITNTVDDGGRGLFEYASMNLSIQGDVLTATVISPNEDEDTGNSSYVVLDQFTITKETVRACPSKAINSNTFLYIDEVTIGDMTNTTGYENVGYVNYSNIVANLNVGTNTLEFVQGNSTNTSYNPHWYVLIDWNGDDIFEASELVGEYLNIPNVNSTLEIAENAPLGFYKMRIIQSLHSLDDDEFCDDFAYGEVEDYTVNISELSCREDVTYYYTNDIPNTTHSSNYIKMKGSEISSGENVVFKAGEYIEILPSEDNDYVTLIGYGSEFEASIEDCSESAKTEEKATDDALSLFEKEPTSFNVYPNPFSNIFSIEYRINQETPVTIEIYSMTGRLEHIFMEDEWHYTGNHSVDLDGSHFSKGIYIVNIKTSNEQFTQKLVKL